MLETGIYLRFLLLCFFRSGSDKVITIESNEAEQDPAISSEIATIDGNPARLLFCSYPYIAWTEDGEMTKLHLIYFSNW
jgi:hypothetical protein